MNNCPKCGASNNQGVKFCILCGAELTASMESNNAQTNQVPVNPVHNEFGSPNQNSNQPNPTQQEFGNGNQSNSISSSFNDNQPTPNKRKGLSKKVYIGIAIFWLIVLIFQLPSILSNVLNDWNRFGDLRVIMPKGWEIIEVDGQNPSSMTNGTCEFKAAAMLRKVVSFEEMKNQVLDPDLVAMCFMDSQQTQKIKNRDWLKLDCPGVTIYSSYKYNEKIIVAYLYVDDSNKNVCAKDFEKITSSFEIVDGD